MHPFEWLAEGEAPHRFGPGQMIYLQGTQADVFYYLVSGSARSYISSESGEERILTVHHPGDLMGEASFFDACPRVSSAAALTDSEAVVVSRRRLDRLFAAHPELALPMLQYLARTVRLLSDHVNGAFLPADRRIARHLLSLEPRADGAFPCTHEGIGQAVGVSRVTVSRVLSEFCRRGWIKTGYRGISLLDRSALSRFTEEA